MHVCHGLGGAKAQKVHGPGDVALFQRSLEISHGEIVQALTPVEITESRRRVGVGSQSLNGLLSQPQIPIGISSAAARNKVGEVALGTGEVAFVSEGRPAERQGTLVVALLDPGAASVGETNGIEAPRFVRPIEELEGDLLSVDLPVG